MQQYPMTSMQKAYYIGRQISDISTKVMFSVITEKDLPRLEKALNRVIQEQPALRTVFTDTYEQRILEETPDYHISVQDIREMSKQEQEQYLDTLFDTRKGIKSDPSCWPLFAISAYQTDAAEYTLFMEFDMLIFDGVSIKIFADQLQKYYEDVHFSVSENNAFFSYVQKKAFRDSAYDKAKQYWERKIPNFPAAPSFNNSHPMQQSVFFRKKLRLSKERLNEIEEMAKQHYVTAPTVLLAAYAKTLALYSGQTRFTLNLPVFDRSEAEEMSAIGDFTAVILLDIDTKGKNFWELCRSIQIAVLEAMRHKRVDGTEVMEMIAAEHGKDYALFPIVFTSMIYKNMQSNMGLKGKIRSYSQTSNVYLDCQISMDNGVFIVNWDYDSDYFSESLISAMFEVFSRFLEGKSEEISIDPAYVERVTVYNQTIDNSIFRGSLLNGILKQMQTYPDKIAVRDSDKAWTYAELESYAHSTATYLVKQGLQKGDKVVVTGYRTCETVGCILGTLMAGGVYVPVDPAIPDARKEYISELCHAICMDHMEMKVVASETERVPPCPLSGEDEAYIIFTSGSTGTPKGVVITHGAAMNTVDAVNKLFQVSSEDIFLCVSSFGFDLSVYDLFGAFNVGAEVLIAEDRRDVFKLHQMVSEYGVTIMNIVPALMQIYIDALGNNSQSFTQTNEIAFDDRESLRIVIMSGDFIPPSLPGKIYDAYENVSVYSGGGATEGAVWSIYYPISKDHDFSVKIPYGYPLPNQKIYVLNDDMELCPENVIGNICISGEGLAKEYFKDAEKTNAAFVETPNFGRVYITGDLGIMTDKGYVDFNGRKDSQVKLNGFRIELGEIETALKKNTAICQCAAVLKKNRFGHPILAVYFTSDEKPKIEDLRQLLSKQLPSYMVPSVIKQLSSLPLSSNAKIDIKALIALPDETEQFVETEQLTEVESNVLQILSRTTELNEVSVNDDLFEIGLDSLNAIAFYSGLKEEYTVDLNMVFQYHTIRALSAHITKCDDSSRLEQIEKMKRQAIFENDDPVAQKDLTAAYEQYLGKIEQEIPEIETKIQKDSVTVVQKVLLTGATGFIGAYLVRSIMQDTNFTVYCVVRGEHLQQRVEENLRFYFGEEFYKTYQSRIVIVSGDLAEENMGIDFDCYQMLLHEIRIVYHCAAKVAHYGKKEDFTRNNVTATENVLKFCLAADRAKCVVVSTTRLLYTEAEQEFYLYTEYTQAADCIPREMYAESKIEAEQLVQHYRERGVNASIIRVGTVMAEYDTGLFQKNIESNAFYIVMKALFKLKMFPAIETEILDFSYVDSVASAILKLSTEYDCCNETFHVFNNDKLSESEFYGLLHAAGLPNSIQLLPFDEYYDAIYDMYLEHENKILIDDILLHASTYISFDGDLSMTAADRTETILKKLGFSWKKTDVAYTEKLLTYGKKIGFFVFDE